MQRPEHITSIESEKLILSWVEKYGAELVEEAVQHGRQFLLHPQNLMENIRQNLENEEESES